MFLDPFYFGRFYFWHFKTKWSSINNYRNTSEGFPKPFGHPSLKVMQTKWSSINNYRSTSEGQPKPFGHPSLIVMQEWTHSLWELTKFIHWLIYIRKIDKSHDIVNKL
jgi:hypothetical protein